MAATVARPKLHVEGSDDLNSIANLIKEYGIDYRNNLSAPEIASMGSVEKLLDGIETAVQVSGGRAIGFVVDADAPLVNRWASIRHRLVSAGVDDVPLAPVEGGFIGTSSRFRSRVGVWLMPDNVRDGSLEKFIMSLIHESNDLISHAESSTDHAKSLGAGFQDKDRLKAIVHSWLAWQARPGLPYGTAINAKYFRHDSPIAKQFISWFVDLYKLEVGGA